MKKFAGTACCRRQSTQIRIEGAQILWYSHDAQSKVIPVTTFVQTRELQGTAHRCLGRQKWHQVTCLKCTCCHVSFWVVFALTAGHSRASSCCLSSFSWQDGVKALRPAEAMIATEDPQRAKLPLNIRHQLWTQQQTHHSCQEAKTHLVSALLWSSFV